METAGALRRCMLAVPASGGLGMPRRVAVAAEIVAAYATLLPLVRSNDLTAMVAAARAVQPIDTTGPTEHRQVAVRLGWLVRRVIAVLPTDGRCLIRSLVLTRLLARRSIPATLVVGVRADGDFAAHAWVEHAGEPVLPAGAYERLVEL